MTVAILDEYSCQPRPWTTQGEYPATARAAWVRCPLFRAPASYASARHEHGEVVDAILFMRRSNLRVFERRMLNDIPSAVQGKCPPANRSRRGCKDEFAKFFHRGQLFVSGAESAGQGVRIRWDHRQQARQFVTELKTILPRPVR